MAGDGGERKEMTSLCMCACVCVRTHEHTVGGVCVCTHEHMAGGTGGEAERQAAGAGALSMTKSCA